MVVNRPIAGNEKLPRYFVTTEKLERIEMDVAEVNAFLTDSEANARLIAAAPELLEALRLGIGALENAAVKGNEYHSAAIHQMRQAISKAEGEI